MHAILLILYLLLCAYGVARLGFIRRSGIKPVVLQVLFGLHVAAGWIHNAIAWRYYPDHGDIWDYFEKSFMYRHRLISQFDLWLSDNDTWTHITHNGIIYIQMLLNCLSFNSLTINTLLFAFPVFLGNIALFRVFRRRFPHDPTVAFTVFLLPSVLFWTSCIHREGVLYMLLGFLLFHIDRVCTRGLSWKRSSYTLFCFLLIVYFRSAMALTLLPALYCWLYTGRGQAKRILAMIGVAAAGLTILLILLGVDFPGMITRQQQEFTGLEGHSRLPLPILDGTWISLIKVLPYAFLNGWFEPLPGAGGAPIYWLFSLELLSIWGIVLFAIGHYLGNRRKPILLSKEPLLTSFGLFSLVFALAGMLMIGIFIPFVGAIVRYRSIYLLFLLAPFLHSLRTHPILQALNDRLSSFLRDKL